MYITISDGVVITDGVDTMVMVAIMVMAATMDGEDITHIGVHPIMDGDGVVPTGVTDIEDITTPIMDMARTMDIITNHITDLIIQEVMLIQTQDEDITLEQAQQLIDTKELQAESLMVILEPREDIQDHLIRMDIVKVKEPPLEIVATQTLLELV